MLSTSQSNNRRDEGVTARPESVVYVRCFRPRRHAQSQTSSSSSQAQSLSKTQPRCPTFYHGSPSTTHSQTLLNDVDAAPPHQRFFSAFKSQDYAKPMPTRSSHASSSSSSTTLAPSPLGVNINSHQTGQSHPTLLSPTPHTQPTTAVHSPALGAPPDVMAGGGDTRRSGVPAMARHTRTGSPGSSSSSFKRARTGSRRGGTRDGSFGFGARRGLQLPDGR